MYVIAWSAIGGVSGAEWLLVGLGVVLDIASYSSRAAQGRYGTALALKTRNREVSTNS